ncbi:MAG: hypothetical protein GYB64_16640 [Chloroflexi bacterium]|nr:hypothetical protein [Chloroflexota bacterium]
MMVEPLLFFLHIPKTGGMTLIWAFEDHFPPRRCWRVYTPAQAEQLLDTLSAEQRAGLRLVCGHESYCFAEHFAQPVRIVTMLRDPVRRAVSQYGHKVRDGAAAFIRTPFPEFVEGLAAGTIGPETHAGTQSNVQVRYLADVSPRKPVVEAHLHIALERLRSGLFAFGLTERFPESVALFQRVMGWSRLTVVTRNRASGPKPSLTPGQSEALQAYHHLDVRLYQAARDHFDAQLRRAGVTPDDIRRANAPSALQQGRLLVGRAIRKVL